MKTFLAFTLFLAGLPIQVFNPSHSFGIRNFSKVDLGKINDVKAM